MSPALLFLFDSESLVEPGALHLGYDDLLAGIRGPLVSAAPLPRVWPPVPHLVFRLVLTIDLPFVSL